MPVGNSTRDSSAASRDWFAPSLLSAGPILALIALFAAATAWLCHGHLMYSIDDPYISLSLAQHIAHGHYGLNISETSSPSSSILYPFLLAAFAWTTLQQWVPLLMNALAAAASAAVLANMCVHYSIGVRPVDLRRCAFLTVTLCIASNIVGLVFTGLEHSLHTLTSILIVYGMALTLESNMVPRWLVPLIVLAPLLRFEGLALSGMCLVALAIRGHFKAALAGGTILAALISLYMTAMLSLGLPPLPSSVLVKTTVLAAAAGTSRHTVLSNLASIWRYRPAAALWLAFLLLLLHPLLRHRGSLPKSLHSSLNARNEILFVAVVAGSVLAHLFFGAWGAWHRYEVYVYAIVISANIVVWQSEIRSFVRRARLRTVLLASLVVFAINPFYVRATVLIPLAGRNIYEQQYQMHRFATEYYRHAVGANDIGWVSYDNPNYVLDLWGLASEAARNARLVTHEPNWLDTLTRSQGVDVAMIYESWFGHDIPANWIELAVMRTAHGRVSAGADAVTFYATSTQAAPAAAQALRRFAGNLPPTVAKLSLLGTAAPE